MTDNEIIKALGNCVDNPSPFSCGGCELGKDNSLYDRLLKHALDLINRLKYESNKYRGKYKAQKVELTRLYDENNRQKAEVERLRNTVKTDFLTVTEKLKLSQSEIGEIKTEAIKEFAERLTEKADGGWQYWITVGDINDLVKEMTDTNTSVSLIDGHIE